MQHSDEFLALVDEARDRVREVPAEDIPATLASSDAVLIDVREDGEWAHGHVRGALHLGRGIIERDIVDRCPDKTTPLYLYCGGGYRSVLAADNLQRMGYGNVHSVQDGWRALKSLLPVSSGTE